LEDKLCGETQYFSTFYIAIKLVEKGSGGSKSKVRQSHQFALWLGPNSRYHHGESVAGARDCQTGSQRLEDQAQPFTTTIARSHLSLLRAVPQ
jgi:hypothetical protein